MSYRLRRGRRGVTGGSYPSERAAYESLCQLVPTQSCIRGVLRPRLIRQAYGIARACFTHCRSHQHAAVAFRSTENRTRRKCFRLKGLLQLRFEHDTSTTRCNTLRGFSCARIRDRFEHSTRISGRRVLHVD